MDVYKFGGFQFDAVSRQLDINGETRLIRRKLAAVLLLLLKNKHRIVTREELLESVWQGGGYRENSLLSCIAELRKIFGDNVKSPKFIKTYPLNGYQWVFSNTIQANEITKVVSKNTTETNANSQKVNFTTSLVDCSAITRIALQKMKYNRSWQGVALVLLVTFSLLILSQPYSSLSHTEPNAKRIVVLPFSNNTGNENLKWIELGLSDMLSNNLSRLAELQIVPAYAMQQSDIYTASIANENPIEISGHFLDRFNAQYVIRTAISQKKDEYVLSVSTWSKTKLLASEHIEAQDLFAGIDELSRSLIEKLIPVSERKRYTLAYSLNSQANEDYARGLQALHTSGPKLAKHYFQAALINDPGFYWAKAYLAQSLNLLGEWQQSNAYFQDLLALPDIKVKPQLQAVVHLGLSQQALEQGKLVESEKHALKVYTISQQAKEAFKQAEALWQLSKINEIQARWEEQQSFQSQALNITSQFKTTGVHADQLYYVGSPSNSRLETNPALDVKQNRKKLETALKFYKLLNNRSAIARTLLAMGKNYDFEFQTRIYHLKEAYNLFVLTGEVPRQADTLSYLGFLYIQYKQGKNAEPHIQNAAKLYGSIRAKRSVLQTQFLLAFCNLDQGINDHGEGRDIFLDNAKIEFEEVIQAANNHKATQIEAASQVLLGWTLSEQKQHKQAIIHIKAGRGLYQKLNLNQSVAYSDMSIVKEYIDLKQWKSALEVEISKNPNKRTLQYLARANYELRNYQKAHQLLKQARENFPYDWQPEDAHRLTFYKNMRNANVHALLPPEISAHARYCESIII